MAHNYLITQYDGCFSICFVFFFFNAVNFKIHEICLNSHLLYLINNICITPMMTALFNCEHAVLFCGLFC